MNGAMWELYWLTRVICIHDVTTGFIIVSVMAFATLCFGTVVAHIGEESSAESVTRWIKPFSKIIVPIFAVSMLLNIFTPTRDEAAFIVAGGAVVAAAQSDAGQKLAQKSVAVLEGSLYNILGKEAVAKARLDVEKKVVDAVKNQLGVTKNDSTAASGVSKGS